MGGGGPYSFTLGKVLGGKIVNAPAGLILDERTGALAWTPKKDAHGEVPVSITVKNAAGTALHEFSIVVTPGLNPTRAPASCASTEGTGTPLAALVLLTALVSMSASRSTSTKRRRSA